MTDETAETLEVTPTAEIAPIVIQNGEQETKEQIKARERNFSFLARRPDSLDEVEVNGIKFAIPAGSVGSCYWAILKIAYENHDQKVYADDLVKKVAEMMADRDPAKWDEYTSKTTTVVHKKIAKESVAKQAQPWQDRVINNAKTLTRRGGQSPYGKRLHERGHALCFERDDAASGYFILYTGEKAKEAMMPRVKKIKPPKQEKKTEQVEQV